MRGRADDGVNWEKRLNIHTGAGAYEKEDANHSRYEPTSYAVLERLARRGDIGANDVLVDYGCGKGRVGFFMNHATGCKAIGVEYDVQLFSQARENLLSYAGRKTGGNAVHFVCASAETFDASGVNRFYFFNPFSIRILQGVLGRVYESYYAEPREMRLYFYYALDEYRSFLMTQAELQFMDEIDCRDLFHNADERERILIFSVNPG